MLIKEEHFRNLYKKPVIIKNKEFAHEIARNLQIDSIWEDGLSREELSQKMKSLKIDENINSILAIPYIDHTAGMSFHVLTIATAGKYNADIKRREDFSVMINSRKDKLNDSEFEYLENLNVNNDFDLQDYAQSIEIANSYFVNEDIEELRFVEILDEFRNEDFPDDVNVLFYKEGMGIEQMWVRYENIIKVPLIEGTLLNTPFQDMGVSEGDKVIFFPYTKEDSEDVILICPLDKKFE